MAEKDKLSKEVEEQIQSLASDVYIQIEEKLTQLISTVTPKEQVEKIDIEQDPVYLKLQDTYQVSQNEFTEKTKKLSDKIHQLEQENAGIKQKLADELDKQQANEQHFQVELTQNNINFTETIERVEHENNQLKSALTREQDKLSKEQQSLTTELSNKEANLNQIIENLERTTSEQKSQLQEEKMRLNALNQELQNQLTGKEGELLALQKEAAKQKESLAVLSAQEKNLIEQLNTSVIEQEQLKQQHQQQTNTFKQESEQKLFQLNEELQKSQNAESNQQKIVAEQQVKLTGFDDELKQKLKEEQDYKLSINQLSNEHSIIKQQQLADKEAADLQFKQQQQALDDSQQKVKELEIKNEELAKHLATEKSDIKLYDKEVSSLKSQLMLAQESQENILERFNSNREKQEKDNDQVRETIKYLRDENNDIITQNNIEKEKSIERISELENKLTEYRLKFEYAQKQLTQNS